MHSAASHDTAAPPGRDDRRARKQRVLTQGIPSVTRAIADAIVLKDGDLFLITQLDGGVPSRDSHGFGLYYHDCRFVSTYDLRINGVAPVVLGAGAGAGYHGTVQLTNPELTNEHDTTVSRDTLGIEWVRELDGRALTLADTITIRNWSHDAVDVVLGLRFGTRFEDIYEVRGLWGEQLGKLIPPQWVDGTLHFSYHGADGIDRSLRITVPPALTPADGPSATGHFRLEARAEQRLDIQLAVHESDRGATPRSPGMGDGPGHRARPCDPSSSARTRPADPWPSGIAKVTSDSIALNDILDRSFADLQLLKSTLRGHAFVAAGIPWFATLFGRDSLITSLQLLAYTSPVTADTLRLLALYQGEREDHWRDEAPGKILHELRVGEMAGAGAIPHNPYYGTVDATPLFLLVLARYVAWTGDLALFDELKDHVVRALDWIDGDGDSDGDGYIEYQSASEQGLINQGWKDSGDAIVDEQGQIATPPIALVEVQAYVYAAKLATAELYERRGDTATAARLRHEAEKLKARFNRDFWVEPLGFYAMALEAHKQPLRVVSSNPGHALWCGIADPAKAARVAERLVADDMFSGWGVRTLSTDSRGYTPIGYHLGTVWPHDNAFVAAGLKRYGFSDEARRIFDSLVDAAKRFEHDRLPELFTGFTKQEYGAPIRYPVACHPQAWAAGSLPYLLIQLLGLEPSALDHRLRIVRPTLPGFVHTLELEHLRVGDATVHLRFARDGGGKNDPAAVHVVSVQGELEVEIEQARNSG